MKLNIKDIIVAYAMFTLTLSFVLELLLGNKTTITSFPSITSYVDTSTLYAAIEKDLGGAWALSLPTINFGGFVNAIVNGMLDMAHAFSLGAYNPSPANYTINISLGTISLSFLEIPIIYFLEIFFLIYNFIVYIYTALTWIYAMIIYPYQFIPSPFGIFFETLALTMVGLLILLSIQIVGSGFRSKD